MKLDQPHAIPEALRAGSLRDLVESWRRAFGVGGAKKVTMLWSSRVDS
jgi:hypothetical protein